MPARIIDGQAYAQRILEDVTKQVRELSETLRPAKLSAVQVGQSSASKLYTNMQAKQCESVGIVYQLLEHDEQISQDQLTEQICKLNADPDTSGIILQLPLPSHLDAQAAQLAIDPAKDVEGIHPVNLGRLFSDGGGLAPPTAQAAVELLRDVCPDLAGRQAVVVGRSDIVGKPIAMLLLLRGAPSPTVTVCHSQTRDLAEHTRRAEIVIVATGASQMAWQGYRRKVQGGGAKLPPPDLSYLVTADMLSENAIVIDVATNRIPKGFHKTGEPFTDEKGKTAMVTVGDVDFQAASRKVSAITPVPGGVGPVTVAVLLRNTVRCAIGAAG